MIKILKLDMKSKDSEKKLILLEIIILILLRAISFLLRYRIEMQSIKNFSIKIFLLLEKMICY